MKNINEDYFLHRIQHEYQAEANILLATTGVLKSTLGTFTLVITSVNVEEALRASQNIQTFSYKASVVDSANNIVKVIDAVGSPNQCFEYFSHKFEQLLLNNSDAIYLPERQLASSKEDARCMGFKVEPAHTNENELSLVQKQVDNWIQSVGIRYFNELTNLSNLIEEVGELARLIGREYGEQSFKAGEKPASVKSAIADELSDVTFIVVCLANQLEIDLSSAFSQNLLKKTKRDNQRHKDNLALNNKEQL